MKFLLTLSSTNPDADTPGYAAVELTPERASRLLELHRRALAFVGAMDAEGLASRFFSLSLGSDLGAFDALIFDDAFVEAFGSSGDGEAVVPFPDNLEVTVDHRYPVECFRVELGERALRFTALPKHGDSRLTCANIYDQVVSLASLVGSAELP